MYSSHPRTRTLAQAHDYFNPNYVNLARFISLATPAFFMKVEKTLAGVPPSEQTVYKLLEKLDGEGLLNVPAAGGADGDEVAFPSTYQFDSVSAQQTHPLWLHDEAREGLLRHTIVTCRNVSPLGTHPVHTPNRSYAQGCALHV